MVFIWGGIAILALMLVFALGGIYGRNIKSSVAFRAVKTWGDRLAYSALILFVVCMAAFVPVEIAAEAAISRCDVFNSVLDNPFAPSLPKQIESKVRGRIGCQPTP